jgi:hypothetical protein
VALFEIICSIRIVTSFQDLSLSKTATHFNGSSAVGSFKKT